MRYDNYGVDSMFKIAKLEKVNNENVNINLITQEQSRYDDGKKISFEAFNTFFSIEMLYNLFKTDFKDYIFGGEILLKNNYR